MAGSRRNNRRLARSPWAMTARWRSGITLTRDMAAGRTPVTLTAWACGMVIACELSKHCRADSAPYAAAGT
jgi:hypothetical protein